ncbi:hypothetical protein ACFV4F_32595 [Kitasatospora sp. NPDC059722]|uniref:hypothetical protein n=1 Tax=unclassified Kitasatospora TaxID=2633591 RepID=UPI0036AE5BB0
MDMEQAWQAAELRWRCGTLAGFVAACTDVEGRAREAARLAGEVFATDPGDVAALQAIHGVLATWADELGDHPHRPAVRRPEEADRRIRDHLKDVLRTRLPVTARDRLAAVQLSLDVDFDVLRRLRTLSAEEREDVFYVYGRATAALDLGHLDEAERGAKHLDALRRQYAG